MINEHIKIFKNYYSLVKKDRKKLIPYYIGYIVNIILELIIPVYIAKITEDLTDSLFISAIISILMYFCLKQLASIISYFNMHNYSNFFKSNYITLYKKIIKEIYNFDSEYKKKFSTGKMINSLTTDVINVGEMADNILTIILNIFKCIVVLFYFLRVNVLFLIFIVIIDVIYINRSNYLNNMATKYLMKQRRVNDKLIGLINQTLLGLKDIQSLDFSKAMNNKYNIIYKSWRNMYDSKRKYQIFRKTILKCFLTLTKTMVYFICAYLIINNKMGIGVMLIIISYFDSLFASSETIMSSLESIKEQNISVNRIYEILNYNKTNELQQKNIIIKNGLIEFNSVYFSYNNDKFLENLNFKIKPNKITAIIGVNGAGKTTIIDLILKQLRPIRGEILIDNINIKNIDKKEYLKEISVLNQDTYLFNLSVRQNLNLINNNVQKQEEICKFIGIDKFIDNLPKGYDTVIDENSNNISGGQKRLLSLARTLLKESKILILDEATSYLDAEMTQNFVKILKKLKEDHTIIIITHKKEILKLADDVIRIEKGKIK